MKFPRNDLRQPNRRSFFGLRKGAPWKQQIPVVASGGLLRYRRRAMACRFEILLPGDAHGSWPLVERAFSEIHRLEARLSVFRESSEISRLNRLAAKEAVRVEADLLRLLLLAKRLSRMTQGAFDPTSAPLSRCWGFLEGARQVPEPTELQRVLECVGYRHLDLDPAARTVQFAVPLELNLGAIGKGYALDRAAAILRSGVTSFLIHAGHSTVLAEGRGPDDSVNGWRIGLRHPDDHSRDFAEVVLRQGALSTSGAAEQKFSAHGREYGHIIDPRSGRPADCNRSATATAPTAAVADALSTAFYLMTVPQVEELCRVHPDIGAVIVPAGEEPGIQILQFGDMTFREVVA